MTNTTRHTHGASCACEPCMEQSDRAFIVWYDEADADPAAAVVAQALAITGTSLTSSRAEPPAWQHQPPTCRRCGAKMRYPRPPAGDGWTWGAFGWQHDCGWHR